MAVDLACAEVAVALALARELPLERGLHPLRNGARGFAVGIGLQRVRRDGADFDLDVDAVQQWAGNAPLVVDIIEIVLPDRSS